jgi:hypothetical protein
VIGPSTGGDAKRAAQPAADTVREMTAATDTAGSTGASNSTPAPATDTPAPATETPAAVTPAPTAEEAAAIMAATEALWPRVVVAAPEPPRRSAWRFSGRWWSRPLPLRRDRPYR